MSTADGEALEARLMAHIKKVKLKLMQKLETDMLEKIKENTSISSADVVALVSQMTK